MWRHVQSVHHNTIRARSPSDSSDLRSSPQSSVIRSVSSSVGFTHGLSAVGRRLTGRAARGAGTEGSSRLTVDIKQSVYLVPSRRTDAFLTRAALPGTLKTLGFSHQVAFVPPDSYHAGSRWVRDAERFRLPWMLRRSELSFIVGMPLTPATTMRRRSSTGMNTTGWAT